MIQKGCTQNSLTRVKWIVLRMLAKVVKRLVINIIEKRVQAKIGLTLVQVFEQELWQVFAPLLGGIGESLLQVLFGGCAKSWWKNSFPSYPLIWRAIKAMIAI
jgi:hypothetical protein